MRVLVLRLSSLGDILLTQPILAELRELFPEAELHFLCKPQFSALPALFGCEITALEYEKSLRWHLQLTKQSYDLVIDLHGKFSTWLIRTLVRGKRKAVYNKQRGLRQSIVRGRGSARVESTVRLYYSALEQLYPNQFRPETALKLPRLVRPILDSGGVSPPARDTGKRRVGLFPGAAHATKAYPVRQWMDFIRLTRGQYEFLLLGNANDGILAKVITQEFGQIPNLCGKLDLRQLAFAVEQCDAIISGDSGPMHLAAALAKPQIAIFGSTHPRLGFAPLNAKARILCADLDCQPCSLHGRESCPQGHFRCMKEVTPTLLAQTLEELLPS